MLERQDTNPCVTTPAEVASGICATGLCHDFRALRAKKTFGASCKVAVDDRPLPVNAQNRVLHCDSQYGCITATCAMGTARIAGQVSHRPTMISHPKSTAASCCSHCY